MNYKRNKRDCYLCHIRKKLIYITSEETVRQKLIERLINFYGVPHNLISVEVPMSRYQKGVQGRADIIVNYEDKELNLLYPLIVVECKEPNVPITTKTLEQVKRYNNILGAKVFGVTNGVDTFWFLNDENQSCLSFLPTYKEILEKHIDEFDLSDEVYSYERLNYRINNQYLKEFLINENILGVDSSSDIIPVVANLCNLLLDNSIALKPQKCEKFKIISDGGIRTSSYGNAGGGNWSGTYRFFILEDSNQNHQIISMAIMATLKTINDPHWGNQKGKTVFVVAIDDNKESHNSLQMDLEKSLEFKNNLVEIFHDGKITVGSHGSAKKDEMVNFVRKFAPELIFNNRIKLGALNNSFDFSFNNPDVNTFIINLLKYVLCREEFRKQFKINKLANL